MMAATSMEHETLVRLTSDLELAIKADLHRLGSQLVSEGLITTDKYREIRNTRNPLEERAADLVGLVQDKVGQNAQCYRTFIAVLENDRHQYGDILGKLQQTYNSMAISSRSTGILVIVLDWLPRNYGSKRTESEGAARGQGLFT